MTEFKVNEYLALKLEDDKEADIWDFMATANIESMTYKDDPNDVVSIKLNSLFFKSPLD